MSERYPKIDQLYIESERELLDQPNGNWINSAGTRKWTTEGGQEAFMGAIMMPARFGVTGKTSATGRE